MNNIKLANISHPKGIRLYTIVIDFVSMKAFSEPVTLYRLKLIYGNIAKAKIYFITENSFL